MPPTNAQIGFGTILAYGGGPQPVPTASGYLASGSFTLTEGLAAAVADDAAVAVTQGDEVFTQVAEVMGDISINQSMDEVEATHHGSPGRRREYVPTLISGDASFSVNFLPNDTGQQAILNGIFALGAVRNWRIIYPVTPAAIDQFSAFLTSFNITAPLADKMTAEIGMRVTGPVTRV